MATQVWASGKRKPVPGTKPKRRRRRRLRVRSRKNGMLAALWALTTAVFTIAWLILGGFMWLLAAVFGALAAVMLAIATFNPDEAVPAPASKNRGGANPRRSGGGKPRKPTAGGSGPRKRVCSARCRASTKPITDCKCVCGGKTHGARNRDA